MRKSLVANQDLLPITLVIASSRPQKDAAVDRFEYRRQKDKPLILLTGDMDILPPGIGAEGVSVSQYGEESIVLGAPSGSYREGKLVGISVIELVNLYLLINAFVLPLYSAFWQARNRDSCSFDFEKNLTMWVASLTAGSSCRSHAQSSVAITLPQFIIDQAW
jgi:hypothetical protein